MMYANVVKPIEMSGTRKYVQNNSVPNYLCVTVVICSALLNALYL